jgi:hypothetical protein
VQQQVVHVGYSIEERVLIVSGACDKMATVFSSSLEVVRAATTGAAVLLLSSVMNCCFLSLT